MKADIYITKTYSAKYCMCGVAGSVADGELKGEGDSVNAALKDMEQRKAQLIKDGVEVPPLHLVYHYNLAAFFDRFPMAPTALARRLGINVSLMRQYATGIKTPSPERMKEIERGIHDLGRELELIQLF